MLLRDSTLPLARDLLRKGGFNSSYDGLNCAAEMVIDRGGSEGSRKFSNQRCRNLLEITVRGTFSNFVQRFRKLVCCNYREDYN